MSGANLRILDQRLGKEKEYWLRKLSADSQASAIMLDFSRPASLSAVRECARFEVEQEAALRLLDVCGKSELLVFTFFLTVLKICLYKHGGVEEVIVGTAIHDPDGDLASINRVLALRDRVCDDLTATELLQNVKRTLSEAYANQKFPFDRVVELLGVGAQGNRNPLFDVVAILDDEKSRRNVSHLKNDFTLAYSVKDDRITFAIEYDPALLKRETIEVFAEHQKTVLRGILRNPKVKISDLELLTPVKKNQLVYNANSTRQDYPGDKTAHELFEEQAEKKPSNVGVMFGDLRHTYYDLNCGANQLAHHLQELGVGPGARVGIFLRHSPDMVVALLATLKAGAAYVPLDPSHPKARLDFVMADSEVQVLLTQKELAGRLPESVAKVVCVDSDHEAIARHSKMNPRRQAGPDDLAYVIYTSGSTGKPKGVKISHRSLVNYVWWAKQEYLKNEELNFCLYSSLAFDLTVTSIYTPLLSGNAIIIHFDEDKEALLSNVIKDERVGVLKLTPSHLWLIKDRDNSKSEIKRLILGGEALGTELAKQVHRSFDGRVEIYNEYGPTEATVGCMIYKYDPATDDRAFVPIGRPAANVQVYVLDKELRPVAENIAGELCISGDGLAGGYLNRDDLTAEKFVANPFIPGRSIYKTGDFARWLPCGVVEFIGRKDDQVKFHGHRVELAEISAALCHHPQVKNAVIVVTTDGKGNDVMIAYYVSEEELSAATLRAFLSESIIREIIPNFFVHLERLPLTINGKINYDALPKLEEVRPKVEGSNQGPRDWIEEVLASIWSELLDSSPVNLD
ncbi:MAG TPA: amino acid adenylation domain-containing protein, partial [Blastocatellia bacterium]|nr:amino acid adenylation domain-containing protein [Blastocatellia bacterium]